MSAEPVPDAGQRAPVLSVVVPMFNEEAVAASSYGRLRAVLEGIGEPFELLFVDDGSRDGTRAVLQRLHAEDPRVHVLPLSRNFGHQAAISAGLDVARGQAVVIIDGDLQDPPELIPTMVTLWRKGYDVVYGQRRRRQGEGWFKRVTAALFYRLLRSLTETPIPLDTGDFRLLDRRVVEVLRGLRERHRFLRGLVGWIGFRQTAVEYERQARPAGVSKYTLAKMVRLGTDAVTGFSHRPLLWPLYLGLPVTGTGLVLTVLQLGRGARAQAVFDALVLLLDGVILASLGVLGMYLAAINDEVRQRPLYVVDRPPSEEQGAGRP